MLNHLSQQERSVEEFRDGLKQRNPLIRGRGGGGQRVLQHP